LRDLATQAAASLAFSAVHVAGMVTLRKLLFAMAGETYAFVSSSAELLYEFRKDALVCLATVAGYWMSARLDALERTLAERRAAPPPELRMPGVLALRDGARTLQVKIGDFLWAASAGNYAEIALGDGRKPLVRRTLQGFAAALLPHGFVRVHRTRLVNAACIGAMDSKDTGDMVLSLDDGSELGSRRRYRALEAGGIRLNACAVLRIFRITLRDQ
jgi:DNA-binding LytR/AlgR family response regulator